MSPSGSWDTPPGCSHVLDPDSVHPNLSPADLRLQTWASRRVLLPLRLNVEPPSCDSADAWPPLLVCWENSPRAQSCSDTCTRCRWPTPLPGVRLPRSSSCTESLSGVCHAFLQIQVRALPAGLGIRPSCLLPALRVLLGTVTSLDTSRGTQCRALQGGDAAPGSVAPTGFSAAQTSRPRALVAVLRTRLGDRPRDKVTPCAQARPLA